MQRQAERPDPPGIPVPSICRAKYTYVEGNIYIYIYIYICMYVYKEYCTTMSASLAGHTVRWPEKYGES